MVAQSVPGTGRRDREDTMRKAPRFQSLRVISALMIREMITRYGRSAGGYIWALLEPIGMIAILTLAFSQFIRVPPIGESFAFFYATGYVPFHLYSEIAGNTSNAVHLNRTLMQFPMVSPLDAILARFMLSVLTLIVVTLIVFTGISIIVDEPVRAQLGPLLSALGCAALLGLGIGTLNTVLFSFFPIWRQLWLIINRPLFIVSAVFFTFESMPSHIQALLWWNPLVHVVGQVRVAFYPVYEGAYISLGYVLAIAFGTFILGAALLARHKTYIIENE